METTHYSPTEVWEKVLQEPEKTNALLLLAFVEDKVAGWCRLFPVEAPETTNLELGIGVLRQVRRRGIGKMLMKHAFDWAQKEGTSEIQLTTHLANFPARMLFKQFGFTDLARVGVDRVIMSVHITQFAYGS